MNDDDGAVLRAEGLTPQSPSVGEGALSVAVPAGRRVVLIGAETTRRSEWLRTLGGVAPPAGGRLMLLGRDCWAQSEGEWRALRCRVGFVPRANPLLSAMDALSNVMLPAVYHGIATRERAREQARALLERLGWRGDPERLPAFLDQGEQRTVAVARALMLEPEVLFVDEPFPSGEPPAVEAAERALTVATELVPTLVVGTWHLGFARHYGDMIGFVGDDGVISVFEGWSALCASGEQTVRRHLEAARRQAERVLGDG